MKINRIFVILMLCLVMFGTSCNKKDGNVSPENTSEGHFYVPTHTLVPSTSPNTDFPPIIHRFKHEEVSGQLQAIHILEIDTESPDVLIKPVLAQDMIFGFELLSSMDQRLTPYAMVNAGFNYSYGQPAGMVIQNGKILASSFGEFPSLIIEGGKARLEEVSYKSFIRINNQKININDVNLFNPKNKIVMYTPEFAKTNRLKTDNLSLTVKNDIVVNVERTDKETLIPEDGYLINLIGNTISAISDVKIGDAVKIETYPQVEPDIQAYECGSWIIKDKEVVIKDSVPWVGFLTQPAPRSAVGIKNGKAVFVTVDGRQPEYSVGMTGRQLADLLIELGVSNAALLDGGASTEIIINHSIVNKPSAGHERLVASGFAIYWDVQE